MSITKCPGHMRSLKLNFLATVLTLGLEAKIFENLRLCQAKFWGELRTRATFDRCVRLLYAANRPRSIYQYSNMAPRLLGQNCKLLKFLFSLNFQKRHKENNTLEPYKNIDISNLPY